MEKRGFVHTAGFLTFFHSWKEPFVRRSAQIESGAVCQLGKSILSLAIKPRNPKIGSIMNMLKLAFWIVPIANCRSPRSVEITCYSRSSHCIWAFVRDVNSSFLKTDVLVTEILKWKNVLQWSWQVRSTLPPSRGFLSLQVCDLQGKYELKSLSQNMRINDKTFE